ncbi:SPOR domain-containing protein [Pedobacter sp. BS3]|uniref:HU domain-containing protein n=1 Tax=Pedobacter sp. BS3 TaxID=2567937 RepID=UPI0011F045FE|nr:SPOR domain-containing protein [Pedobacter sp. BS3]TZF84698.1 SPOR domain-containing protein [Pedobacter sp. BS3]
MDITRYIADLLKTHNEVSVPGFGCFYKKRVEAYYDKDSETFYPPSETIAFRETDTYLNTHLLEYISHKRNISEDSAAYFAEKFGKDIQKTLSETGESSQLPLGDFRGTPDTIIFEPGVLNFSPSGYGLMPLKERITSRSIPVIPEEEVLEPQQEEIVVTPDIPEQPEPETEEIFPETTEIPTDTTAFLTDNEAILEEPEAVATVTAIAEDVLPVQATQPETLLNERVEEEWDAIKVAELEAEHRKRKKRKFWIEVLMFIAIIAVLATAVHYYYKDIIRLLQNPDKPVTEQAISPVAVPVQSPVLSDSLAKLKADSVLQQALEAKGFEVEKPRDTSDVTVTGTTTVPEKVIEIIGASLINDKEAEAYIKRMRARGFDAHVVKNLPGRRVKVSLGTFNTQEQALKELPRIKKVQPDAYPIPVKR